MDIFMNGKVQGFTNNNKDNVSTKDYEPETLDNKIYNAYHILLIGVLLF